MQELGRPYIVSMIESWNIALIGSRIDKLSMGVTAEIKIPKKCQNKIPQPAMT